MSTVLLFCTILQGPTQAEDFVKEVLHKQNQVSTAAHHVKGSRSVHLRILVVVRS